MINLASSNTFVKRYFAVSDGPHAGAYVPKDYKYLGTVLLTASRSLENAN